MGVAVDSFTSRSSFSNNRMMRIMIRIIVDSVLQANAAAVSCPPVIAVTVAARGALSECTVDFALNDATLRPRAVSAHQSTAVYFRPTPRAHRFVFHCCRKLRRLLLPWSSRRRQEDRPPPVFRLTAQPVGSIARRFVGRTPLLSSTRTSPQ